MSDIIFLPVSTFSVLLFDHQHRTSKNLGNHHALILAPTKENCIIISYKMQQLRISTYHKTFLEGIKNYETQKL